MNFELANATHTPALLRFTLFDADGKEAGRYEQILPIGTQREWSLSDLFNIERFAAPSGSGATCPSRSATRGVQLR